VIDSIKDKKTVGSLAYYSSKDIEEAVKEGIVCGEAINNTK